MVNTEFFHHWGSRQTQCHWCHHLQLLPPLAPSHEHSHTSPEFRRWKDWKLSSCCCFSGQNLTNWLSLASSPRPYLFAVFSSPPSVSSHGPQNVSSKWSVSMGDGWKIYSNQKRNTNLGMELQGTIQSALSEQCMMNYAKQRHHVIDKIWE